MTLNYSRISILIRLVLCDRTINMTEIFCKFSNLFGKSFDIIINCTITPDFKILVFQYYKLINNNCKYVWLNFVFE